MRKSFSLFAAAVALFPAAALAGSMTLLGAGNTGVAYQPAAVTFFPETQNAVIGSSIDANGGVDTPHFIAHWWQRCSVGSPTTVTTTQGNESNNTCSLVDMWTNLGNGTCTSETCPGLDNVNDNASGTFGSLRENINDATGGTNHSFEGVVNNYFPALNAAWHEMLWVGDMNFTQGNKRNAFYVDQVKLVQTSNAELGTVGAFNVAVNSALGFAINGHTNSGQIPGSFDMGPFLLDTHSTAPLGCSAIIDASNNVCSAIITAWKNGGVFKNPGSNGSLILGSQPDIYFTGDKTTFGTNVGAATGTFALSNQISGSSATPAIYNAAFGPGGPPTDRPYYLWNAGGHIVSPAAATAAISTSNRGNPISIGNLIIGCGFLADTSVAFNRSVTATVGYTALPTTGDSFPLFYNGTHPYNQHCVSKIADIGDVTAAGSDWGNPLVFAWAVNANALRSASYEIYVYGGANSTTPIVAAAAAHFASTATLSVAPSVTPTSAPSTLLTLNSFWQNRLHVTNAAEDPRFIFSEAAAGTTSYTMAWDKALTTTAATGSITTTQSTAEGSVAINLVLAK